MKFIVDAQISPRIAQELSRAGFDAIHTSSLPLGDATPDRDIIELALKDDRIVITKDGDFVDSHLLRDKPKMLLLISTGNISNRRMIELFRTNLKLIAAAFDKHKFVELTTTEIRIHS